MFQLCFQGINDNGNTFWWPLITNLIISSVVVGFITKGKFGVNHAITDCDFKLYQHGEEHNPPTDYGFTFWAGSSQKLIIIQIKIYTSSASVHLL